MVNLSAYELKRYKSIVYAVKDDRPHMVCYPCGPDLPFLIPITSPQDEQQRLESLPAGEPVLYPDIYADDSTDYHDTWRELHEQGSAYNPAADKEPE